MDNHCGSITKFVEEGNDYHIQSTQECGVCVFYDHEPSRMRMEATEKCKKCGGKCCNNSPCGPWLPCDFLDRNTIRRDFDINDKKYFFNEGLDSPHDLNWKMISEYVKDGKAIIRKFSFSDRKDSVYYIVDVPIIKESCPNDEADIGTRKELGKCALLSETGCKLPLSERPLRGAVFGARDIGGCGQLDNIGSYSCWTEDPYLQDRLKELYDMRQKDSTSVSQFNIHS